MPPRFTYWTIIFGGQPTSFRSGSRDELMPTFKQIQAKHPDAQLRYFARGKLWYSEEEAQSAITRERFEKRRRPGPPREGAWKPRPESRADTPTPDGENAPPDSASGERRGRAWRPGGDHKDPRDRFKVPRDVKRARFKARRRFDDRSDAPGKPDAGGWKPKPQGWKPRPEGWKPKPEGWKPRPEGWKPKPEGWKPKPEGWKPKPEGWKPRPEGWKPKPEGWKPKPAGWKPKPEGWKPKPPGWKPKPEGWKPKPEGWKPKPAGWKPKPEGWKPKPEGWKPKPGGWKPEARGGRKPEGGGGWKPRPPGWKPRRPFKKKDEE